MHVFDLILTAAWSITSQTKPNNTESFDWLVVERESAKFRSRGDLEDSDVTFLVEVHAYLDHELADTFEFSYDNVFWSTRMSVILEVDRSVFTRERGAICVPSPWSETSMKVHILASHDAYFINN